MNQQTEILELEITQADIDLAIARTVEGRFFIFDTCVVSTAAQRQLENPKISSAPNMLDKNNGCLLYVGDGMDWEGDEELTQYMHWFDAEEYDKIVPRKFILVKAT